MKSDSDATAAAPRILFAEDGEPVDGETIDGEPTDDPPEEPPDDRSVQGLPRPLLIEAW
ncbi:MAG: hypothetical protein GY722_10995 [bacterium]|nr:hypothetical protein [bacterium]